MAHPRLEQMRSAGVAVSKAAASATVFNPAEWRVDEAVDSRVRLRAVEPLIVVGVDNAGRSARAHELLPFPDELGRLLLESPSFYVAGRRIESVVRRRRWPAERVYLGVGTNEVGGECGDTSAGRRSRASAEWPVRGGREMRGRYPSAGVERIAPIGRT